MAKKTDVPAYDFYEKGLLDAKEIARDLYSKLQKRRTELKPHEEAYFLEWQVLKGPDDDVKVTRTTDGHDKVRGATNLITATEPSFEVPRKMNQQKTDEKSSSLEKAAKLMWQRSNSIQGMKVERYLAFCGFLYDEMIVQIVDTRKILQLMNDSLSKAKDEKEKLYWEGEVRSAELMVQATPYLFEPVSPMSAEIVRGRMGTDYYYTTLTKRVDEVCSDWGDRAMRILGSKKGYEKVTVEQIWDRTYRYVWVKEEDSSPLYAEPHGLVRIPVASVVPVGLPRLYPDESERQREPLLFGAIKSGLLDRENLILTAEFTNVATMINSQFAFQQATPEDTLHMDHSVKGGIIVLPPGANLTPLVKELVNPDVLALLDKARGMIDQTTIYNQALGQSLEGTDNYSLVSLVAQAGRLPIVGVREGLAGVLNNAMQICFAQVKKAGRLTVTDKAMQQLEIETTDIPDLLEFDVKVDVDLPQDKMQMATIAQTISTGPEAIVSKEYARLNYLNIGNSQDEQVKIWTEQASALRHETQMRELLLALEQLKAQQEQMEQAKAQPAQPGAQPGQPPEEEMEAETEQSVPPGQMAQPGEEEMAPPGTQPRQPYPTNPPIPGPGTKGPPNVNR